MGGMSKIVPKLYRDKAGGIPFPGRRAYMALEPGANQKLTIHLENELMGAGKMPIGIVEGGSVPQSLYPNCLRTITMARLRLTN
jgi:hypothetical protein